MRIVEPVAGAPGLRPGTSPVALGSELVGDLDGAGMGRFDAEGQQVQTFPGSDTHLPVGARDGSVVAWVQGRVTDDVSLLALRVGDRQPSRLALGRVTAARILAVAGDRVFYQVEGGADGRALLGGYARSPVLDLAGDRMIRGDFRTVGSVSLFVKDLGIVADLAAASGVLTPAADVVRRHAVALAATMPDVDHAALVTLFAPDGLDALAPPPGGMP